MGDKKKGTRYRLTTQGEAVLYVSGEKKKEKPPATMRQKHGWHEGEKR